MEADFFSYKKEKKREENRNKYVVHPKKRVVCRIFNPISKKCVTLYSQEERICFPLI